MALTLPKLFISVSVILLVSDLKSMVMCENAAAESMDTVVHAPTADDLKNVDVESEVQSGSQMQKMKESTTQLPRTKSSHRSKAGAQRRRKGDVLQREHEDDAGNPVFPPRSDGFWKKESFRGSQSATKSTKRKHHSSGRTRRPSASSASNDSKGPTQSGADDDRPNIILIITDDQDIELGSMEYMPETLKEFRDKGVEFRHGYVTTPMCCPSRSSMLTGVYVHNHQVYTNNDNCSSVAWRQKYEQKTFAYQLWKSGYYTSYIGKYLNKYDGSHIPDGWDEWNVLQMNSKFYNYTINRNGEKIRHGNTYEYDYYPDLITNDTLDFLQRVSNREFRLPGSKEPEQKSSTEIPVGPVTQIDDSDNDRSASSSTHRQEESPIHHRRKPFLLVVSYPSPHGPEDSAPQYSRMFFNSTPHHTPSYNFAPNLDKQWILRVTNKMTNQLKSFTDLLMTKRLQTLQSVDVAVKDIFDKLRDTEMLDNTFVFYTSDHGYHVGQFGLIKGKSMPYEFDIRVPFFVRVPNRYAPHGTVLESTREKLKIQEPVLNIDLSPTFLDIGRVDVPHWVDGRSFLPLINRYIDNVNSNFTDADWGHTWVIESSGRREVTESVEKSPDGKKKKKHKTKLNGLRRNDHDGDEDDTLRQLCLLHPHPCLPRQKKYCKVEKNQIRFRKCRAGIDYSFPYIARVGNGTFADARCKCKRGRRTATAVVWNWDEERAKIDQEIEDLKLRIDALRETRRRMRNEWILASKYRNGTKSKHRGSRKEALGFFTEGDSKGRSRTATSISPSTGGHELHQPKSKGARGRPTSDATLPRAVENEPVFEDDEDLLPSSFHRSEEEFDNEGDDDIEDDETEDLEEEEEEDERDHVGTSLPNGPIESTATARRGKIHTSDRNGKRHRDRYPLVDQTTEAILIPTNCECEVSPRTLRKIEKEERKRKKLIGKIRKKQKFLHRIEDPDTRARAETCGTEEKMNCFWHDSDHWRTPPLWTDGSFCFCMNANNNSYTCLRSVNSTHNYLYCQFMTGFKMYFDLQKDPHELQNAIRNLPADDEEWMVKQLQQLKSCYGQRDCWPDVSSNKVNPINPSPGDPTTDRTSFGKRKSQRTGKKRPI